MTSASVPHVNWWTRRPVVIEAIGTHGALTHAINTYHASYYFDDRMDDEDKAPFEDGDLTTIARGAGWELSRINPQMPR